MTSKPRVSCIIPAYNEAARIDTVLAVLCGHPLLEEIIVVDDGSSDATAEVARRAGARVIELARNCGKTAALVEGIVAAKGDIFLLIDADLVGLSADNVTALLTPVLAGMAAVAISLRGNAPLSWRLLGVDYISGERAFARDLLEGQHAVLRSLPRFGFEVHFNNLILARAAQVAIVDWPGVASPSKVRKRGFVHGIWADFRMMADIFRVISPMTALRQIHGMRARRIVSLAAEVSARR
ncbi:MAG: glycosyltransferase family 2 protein [Pseudorhodobacter sp.]|nr:glycosyltransferase family 2 protein [Pseudorhodobacter sp.]